MWFTNVGAENFRNEKSFANYRSYCLSGDFCFLFNYSWLIKLAKFLQRTVDAGLSRESDKENKNIAIL
jgi:hypothetical protein